MVRHDLSVIWGPRQSPFYHPKVAQWINERYGAHTLESFLVWLKPLLMFGSVAIVHGVRGLWRRPINGTYDVDTGFILSGGLGFVVAHLILYRRHAVGVFPTWTEPASVSAAATPQRRTLRDALRTYWWTLIGVAIFPTASMVGEVLRIPFDFFILPFFAIGALAGWPYWSGRAPYSFWIVAVGVWFGGAVFTMVLFQLVRVVAGVSPQ